MGSYLRLLLLLADWPLVRCSPAVAIVIADSLAGRVSGIPRYVRLCNSNLAHPFVS